MKQVDEMPKQGQFVAVWEYNGKMWSETYKWENEILYIYSSSKDGWRINDIFFSETIKRKFYIA